MKNLYRALILSGGLILVSVVFYMLITLDYKTSIVVRYHEQDVHWLKNKVIEVEKKVDTIQMNLDSIKNNLK